MAKCILERRYTLIKSWKIAPCALTFALVLALCGTAAACAAKQEASPAEKKTAERSKITERPKWGDYFGKLNGTAVVYDPSGNSVEIYNAKLAGERRPPCSSFKIVSSLIAIEHGIIRPEDSTKKWSGEKFWYDGWNRDIDFYDAFRSSCVWYFRKVADEIGKTAMKNGLTRLRYGNCDISDWEGRMNTNSDNRALTGFWIESSLKISPLEQAEVMERIFGARSEYSTATVESLKKAMLAYDRDRVKIYGKTGLGKDYDTTVDAWFTGFADLSGKRLYFCVYLGKSKEDEPTSVKAREIAIKLISDISFKKAGKS